MSKPSSIHVYDRADDEFAHTPGPDPQWQESVVLIYYDDNAGIGGFNRIGHEAHGPNNTTQQVCWTGAASRNGERFLNTTKHTAPSNDTQENRFSCTDAYVADFSNGIRWLAKEGEYTMDLVAEDFSPRVSPFPHAGESVSEEYAAQHWESAAHVSGTVALSGKQYEINALGYRDHSWGRRNWQSLLSHRWVAGTLGEELTFCAASWQATDGSLASFGYVARNGIAEHAKSVDIVANMEIDATTNRGGRVKFVLNSGEIMVIEATPAIPGFLSENNGIYCVDQICTVTVGDKVGFCDFETTTNPRGGQNAIAAIVNRSDQSGLTTDDFFLSISG